MNYTQFLHLILKGETKKIGLTILTQSTMDNTENILIKACSTTSHMSVDVEQLTFGQKFKKFFSKLFIRKRLKIAEWKIEELRKRQDANLETTLMFYENSNKELDKRIKDLELLNPTVQRGSSDHNHSTNVIILKVKNKTKKTIRNVEMLKPLRYLDFKDEISDQYISLRSGVPAISLRELFAMLSMQKVNVAIMRFICKKNQMEGLSLGISSKDIFGNMSIKSIKPMKDNYQYQDCQVDVKYDFSILPTTSIIISEILAEEEITMILYAGLSVYFKAF